MNRFNKKLTLNLPDSQPLYPTQNDSPSVNNLHPSEKQRYYNLGDVGDNLDSQSADHRQQNSSKLNFIEFQQFNINEPKLGFTSKDYGNFRDTEDKTSFKNLSVDEHSKRHKRNFTIQLPDRDQQLIIHSTKNHNHTETQLHEQLHQKFKEPAGPSKKGKVFIFPTDNSQKIQKIKRVQTEDISYLKEAFERERQQFFKEKSRLQKQIMIKNGQIQMLEKIVKDKYSPTNSLESKDSQFNRFSAIHKKSKAKDQEFEELEAIILQKDIEITDLLERIGYLNELIDKKNQDIKYRNTEKDGLTNIIESLKNQLYIYERKQANQRLTNNLLKMKQSRQYQKQYSKEIDRSRDLNKTSVIGQSWDQDRHSPHINPRDFGTKGLINLQKRLQNLHRNRLDLDERNHKIKSDISVQYPHSTRNMTKGTFDFAGRQFEPSKKLNNRTKIY